ncbi:MAG: hypothetical protein WEB04_00730 [Dehalococcoidia bacterium]
MIEQHEIDVIGTAAAFRALYLLPTAPRALAGEVYRALRDKCLLSANGSAELDGALDRLDRAHEAIARGADGVEHDAPAQRSPWALLHVDCDAPPEVVDLAYRYWQRERGLVDMDFVKPVRPRSEKASLVIRENIDALPLALEQATSAPRDTSAAPLPDEDVRPIRMPSPSAAPARLVVEAGTAHPAGATIGESPLRVGSDPACDIVVGHGRGRTEARLWQREGRVLFHGVAGDTNVNGRAVGWAVLDSGDTVQVGDATFRYEASC